MRVIFATWPTVDYQRRALARMGGNRRLLSYYFMAEERPELMQDYVTTKPGTSPGKSQGWDKSSYRRRRTLSVLRRAKQEEE